MATDISNLTRPGTVQRTNRFDHLRKENDDLASGVAISFPILSLSPGKWTVRWKGVERVIPVPGHPNIPTPWIDVVILFVQKELSRVYYKPAPGGGSSYVQGAHNKPDCWSSNGIKPDDEVPVPVHPMCGTCPMDAWKSGGTPASPNAKACQQRRRTVIVPYAEDLTNEAEGGPMLLSVPPGSLTNQAEYKSALDEIGEHGEHYASIVTRLSYEEIDPRTGKAIKFPRIKFDYLRQENGDPWYLNNEEAEVVLRERESERVKRILNSKINTDGPDVEGNEYGDSEEGVGGVKAPPKAMIRPQVVSPAPAPSQPPKAPGGRPVSGISEAIQSPATPPPSARAVNTRLQAVPLTPVDDGEAEAHAPLPGEDEDSIFSGFMNIK